MTLSDKVALVTGGSRGIGEAIALRLAQEGARVAIASRKPADLKKVASKIESNKGVALPIAADLANPEDCREMVKTCRERLGGLDILVNNAGVPGYLGNIGDCPVDEWKTTLDVNLTGPFLCAKYAVPHMKERGFGRIINLASGAGTQPLPSFGSYGVSKAGVVMLTKYLASELGRTGITVNCVLPGLVFTDMVKDNFPRLASLAGLSPDAYSQAFLGSPHLNAFGRLTEVEEVASLVAYLVSPAGAAITGEVINQGGGWF